MGLSEAAEPRGTTQRPLRVLIVRVGAMGDVLHGLPAVAAMRRLHSDWRIDWAVEPAWRDLLVAQGTSQAESVGPGPIVDTAIAVNTRLWKERGLSWYTVRDVLALRNTLRAAHYDLCIDFQGSVRSAVIGWMAGAKRLVGPADPREKPARLFYTDPVRTTSMHVIAQAYELVRAALDEPLPPTPARFPVDAGAAAELAPAARFVVLAPTAGWGAKEWPVERFGELARRLAATGLRVYVNAGPQGSPQASAVEQAGGHGVEVFPSTIAQLTSLLRRASLFVGGDTGPMQLADALGIPVVALFGPTDPARTGPRGPRSRILRDPASVTDHRRHPHPEAGLARITVEEVMQAAMDLLTRTEDSAE